MGTGLILSEFFVLLTKRNQFRVREPYHFNKYAALFSTSADKSHPVSVADFYSGKSVFITGGTGFIGMALIEKLLYSCSNISNIYVLVRGTEQLNASKRIKTMLENPAFFRIKKEKLSVLNKITPISGNIESPNLGINFKDEELLIEKDYSIITVMVGIINKLKPSITKIAQKYQKMPKKLNTSAFYWKFITVSVVFHSAATTHFNRPLKEALKTNYEGTMKVINLCKKMKHIQAYVHISTAFANTDKKIIEEKVYPPPANINDVYRCLERFGNDEEKIKEILNGRPNTYTFTKALTENFIAEECGTIPNIIIRPSMVGPAIKEPFEGWLHNISAPSALLLAGGIGLNHVILGSKSNITDIVPVDYVANLIIVSPFIHPRSDELIVYNCSTGSINPLYLGEIFEFFNKQRLKFTREDLPLPKVFIVKHRPVRALLTFLTQIIPAFFLDIIKWKSPRYVKRQKKFIAMRDGVEYFACNSWKLKTDNLMKLSESMTESDRRRFPFDISNVKWPDYMNSYANALQTLLNKSKS